MSGPHARSVYVLEKSATIGRAAAADIQILDQRVSRQHARLMVHADAVVLIDLSSANGTYVRGRRVQRRPLRSGDRIQIGLAEYLYEEAPGTLSTSPRFLSKLTTKESLGATIVRKVAKEILASPTAEIPEAELESMRAESRRRTHSSLPFAPRDPSLLSEAEMAGFDTEPLDPRRHAPRPTPVPRRRTLDDLTAIEADAPLAPARPPPVHAPPSPRRSHTPVPESAQHAVDVVLRLLALRDKEARGARLHVQEREGIRRLEAALRSPRMSGNRRRWARLPCKLTARLGDGATSSALVTDIGAGGISIEDSELPIAPGDEVTIRVVLGVDRVSRTAVFQTRVVWVDALEGTFGAVFAGPASWEMAG